jgi:hypothetical protein
MTETSILPGAVPSSDAGVDSVPPGTGVEETEGDGNRRLKLIGLVVGVIVLAVAAFMFLHKGSGSSDQTFVPHSTSSGPTKPVAAAPSKPKPSGKSHHGASGTPARLPKKANHSVVRDPFKPLVVAPVAASGAPSSTTTVSAPKATPTEPTTTPVTEPSTTPVTQPTDGGTTTVPGKGGQTKGAPLSIQLKGVSGRKATFDVFYAHHKFRKFVVEAPKPSSNRGTVFDKIFALIGIQNGQVTIQIGDDTPFDLSTGVSHLV